MDVVALQEVRLLDHDILTTKAYKIYVCGNMENKHERGVAFAVRKSVCPSILSFENINDRLCYLRLKGKFKNISVVCAYAPTEESDDEIKDPFYDDLEQIWSRIPNYDIKILLADMNAHGYKLQESIASMTLQMTTVSDY